ncbi:MAG TPA: hypothetical protein VLI90_05705 [Tepidisphaeraceae bacterium]|nr:hypothetical protein [Tepidisphaeraceae bacterium]
MRTTLAVILLTSALLPVAGGCEQALETGYIPRKLNASESERRAFYAPEYTPEANGSKDSPAAAPNLGMTHR